MLSTVARHDGLSHGVLLPSFTAGVAFCAVVSLYNPEFGPINADQGRSIFFRSTASLPKWLNSTANLPDWASNGQLRDEFGLGARCHHHQGHLIAGGGNMPILEYQTSPKNCLKP
jgi:hypothetical protein